MSPTTANLASTILLFPRHDHSSHSNDNTAYNTDAACAGPLPPGQFQIWPYCPSLPAAIAASLVFALPLLAHIILAIHHRKLFCLVIALAAAGEAVGFAMRAFSATHQLSTQFYSSQSLTITLSPLLLNAFVYMVLGRLVDLFIPSKTIAGFYSRFIACVFVWADVLTFIVQAAGAVMAAIPSNPMIQDAGKDIYVGGVGLQLAFQVFFFALATVFHRKMLHLASSLQTPLSEPRRPGWHSMLYTLYAVFLLITARTIFKMVEFSAGVNGPVPTHEWYLYAFDAAPIFAALCILALIHPGRVLRGPGSEYAKLGKVERRELRRRVEAEEGIEHKNGGANVEMGPVLMGDPRRPRGGSIAGPTVLQSKTMTAYAGPGRAPHQARHQRYASAESGQDDGLVGLLKAERDARSRSASPVPPYSRADSPFVDAA